MRWRATLEKVAAEMRSKAQREAERQAEERELQRAESRRFYNRHRGLRGTGSVPDNIRQR